MRMIELLLCILTLFTSKISHLETSCADQHTSPSWPSERLIVTDEGNLVAVNGKGKGKRKVERERESEEEEISAMMHRFCFLQGNFILKVCYCEF